ncbi:L-ascorbate metabolism protein UlaG, beta-lactamase superfamily [Acidaminobacter hydrogenoformans DSM 2784]|uniref:L-ascorbate metabolism protein UlaG, beta-lactamase superfamily n=2 Tax=Acidaminobacter TaxID=65402 RepID=A0A1G5S0E7_9FIRM|nr:L-ascorbate metabolism protein UlaG, beta-lactamase superfamily [Acidaminobacter hydrogenoformans DSM 2784]
MLTYISNAGVMLSLNGKKILIDPLTTPDNQIYVDTEPGIRGALLQNAAPYNDVDVVLVSHHHRDHFHAESMLQLLKAQPGSQLVSTPEVVRRVLEAAEGEAAGGDWAGLNMNAGTPLSLDRLRVVDLATGEAAALEISGVKLQVFRTLHDGEDYAEVPNLMFVIECGMVVAHLGDSAPVPQNFAGAAFADAIARQPIDLLIANFPYIAIPAARKLVAEMLKPAALAVVHFPDPYKEAARWATVAKKSFARVQENYLPAVLLETLGECVALPLEEGI